MRRKKIFKLKKAIYSLKQSASAWNLKLSETLEKLSFIQGIEDKCLYKQTDNEGKTYILVYVDDLLVAGNQDRINKIISQLNKHFQITDLGEVNSYLGMNICRSQRGTITIDQENKIDELVKNFNLEEAKPCSTPMVPGYVKDNSEENLLETNTCYRRAIGGLLYIATTCRPDIAAAVNILSRKTEKPTKKDFEAVKRIIKYLKTTKDLKLVIDNKREPILQVFADSDWANDPSDRRSTIGNLFKLGNNSLLWLCKRQNCIALSSAEAEYISAANATTEIIWLVKLLQELDMEQTLPIVLFEDNQSTIKLIQSDKHHSRTKHIDVRHHHIKHHQTTGTIELKYCPTDEMIADQLTKPLPKPQFEKHRIRMNLLKT